MGVKSRYIPIHPFKGILGVETLAHLRCRRVTLPLQRSVAQDAKGCGLEGLVRVMSCRDNGRENAHCHTILRLIYIYIYSYVGILHPHRYATAGTATTATSATLTATATATTASSVAPAAAIRPPAAALGTIPGSTVPKTLNPKPSTQNPQP